MSACGVDGHAAVADLAQRARVVGVAAHERRHVERDRQAAAARAKDQLVAIVGLHGVAVAGELANRPRAAAISRRIQPSRERVFAGPADALEPWIIRPGRWAVQRVHLDAAERREVSVALLRLIVSALPAFPSGLDLLRTHPRIVSTTPERSLRRTRTPR
jgi:hypothetical protein